MSLAGDLFRPSFRHADESFEGWASRRGSLRQIQRLRTEAYLERLPGGKADRVYRLTPKGRMAALGGWDPEERWGRAWDGRWRLLMFDLPQKPAAPRARLRKVLREHGLGCLQGSVWLSPDPVDAIGKQLRGDRHPASLLLFEGRTVGGEKPAEMVGEAWDFEGIDLKWGELANLLEQGKSFLSGEPVNADAWHQWAAAEQGSWKTVLESDPLLPDELLPRSYRGRKIWKQRLEFWSKLAARFRETGFPAPD